MVPNLVMSIHPVYNRVNIHKQNGCHAPLISHFCVSKCLLAGECDVALGWYCTIYSLVCWWHPFYNQFVYAKESLYQIYCLGPPFHDQNHNELLLHLFVRQLKEFSHYYRAFSFQKVFSKFTYTDYWFRVLI